MEKQKQNNKIDTVLNRLKDEFWYDKDYGLSKGFKVITGQTYEYYEEVTYPYLWFWKRTETMRFKRVFHFYEKLVKQGGFKVDVTFDEETQLFDFYISFKGGEVHRRGTRGPSFIRKSENTLEYNDKWVKFWEDINNLLTKLSEDGTDSAEIKQ